MLFQPKLLLIICILLRGLGVRRCLTSSLAHTHPRGNCCYLHRLRCILNYPCQSQPGTDGTFGLLTSPTLPRLICKRRPMVMPSSRVQADYKDLLVLVSKQECVPPCAGGR